MTAPSTPGGGLSRPQFFRVVRHSVTLLTGLCLLSNAPAIEWQGLQPIGSVTTVARDERGVRLDCADGATVQVSVLAPDLVRVRTRFAGQPDRIDHSWAIVGTNWSPVPHTVTDAGDTITLATSDVQVVIHRDPLLIEFRDPGTQRIVNADERPMARDAKTGRVAVAKRFGFDEHFYGLGEKAARLDRRRSKFTLWNSDTPGYVEGTDPIYQSIPFYLGLDQGRAYGLFYDNSHRSTFDLGYSNQDHAAFCAEGGEVDYYFFQGPDLKKIIGRYTELTGRMPMQPLWSLGHQQSRYSYYPDTMVDQVVDAYRRRDLPLDVVHLDIHYMQDYRVFTWNKDRFPDPAALLKRVEHKGVKVITIIDPGVKHQPEGGYPVFDEGLAKDYFLRRTDGSLYIGEVWPGKSVFVDYTKPEARKWWGELHKALLGPGIDGIWTDMNEPSDFVDKSGDTQKDVVFDDQGTRSLYARNRNTFALNMARATYEGLAALQPDKRPFVITRAGYAGIQRYAITWTGDNNADFPSLALNIPMFASMGLSGQAFVGADIPGFIGRGDGELLARSYQLASLVPFCRNHGAVDQYDHEPWRYGAAYEGIVRTYLKLRYRLLPYLYTVMEEAHRTGVPWFRPLVLEFPQDESTYNLDDQFMVGSALLAAPVLRAGERAREVYLPSALWYDFWSGDRVVGGDLLRVDAPLDRLPLYVRGGSILPSTQAMNHVTEKPWSPLRFDVYPDADGSANGSLYEDDGTSLNYQKGVFRRTQISLRSGPGGHRLTIAAPEGSHHTPPRLIEVAIHAAPTIQQVVLDGKVLTPIAVDAEGAGWFRDSTSTVVIRYADDTAGHTLDLR